MRPRWLGDKKGKPLDPNLKEALIFFAFLLLTFFLAQLAFPATIGVENKNPGNIRSFKYKKWKGATGLDPWHHIIFKDDLHGMRAIKKVLKTYWKKHKIHTAEEIAYRYISKHASDKERIDYAKTLCQFTRRGSQDILDMTDPYVLKALAKGIVRHENGKVKYPESLYNRVFLEER